MPSRKTPQTFAQVIAAGERRASLEALRDRLALAVESAESRELAGLSKQLAEVLREIDGLPVKERSKLDDLAARRVKRRTAVSKRAGGERVGGPGGG